MSPRVLRASSGSGSGQRRRFGAHRYLYSKTNGLVCVSLSSFPTKMDSQLHFLKIINCAFCLVKSQGDASLYQSSVAFKFERKGNLL